MDPVWQDRRRKMRFAQWQAIVGLDIATEVGLFVMAVHLVWGLQAAVSTKLRVIFAFGLRLP
jgi:hypothetical protein